MAVKLNEDQVWQDTGGKPIVNGFLYFGFQGADPKISPIPIFSNRALTVVLANPQRTDSFGRAVNKIWLSGRYSIKVEDSANVQQYQELDNGLIDVAAEGGTRALDNITGINAITGSGDPVITELGDNAQFVFQVVSENTADEVTLDIDGLGAQGIKRNFDQPVGKGKFKAGQTILLSFNVGAGTFQWINENARVVFETQGENIASAATVDLSIITGNNIIITGNTGPIATLGTMIAGVRVHATFTGNPKITNSASIVTLDGKDVFIKIGDKITFLSKGTNVWEIETHETAGVRMPAFVMMPYGGLTAPAGWLLAKGGTISNAASGGTVRANADCNELFNLIWDSMANAQMPLQDNTGTSVARGGSAQADFDANRRITIPDMQGKSFVGTGGTLPATQGSSFGAETHTLSISEMPSHTHTQRASGVGGSVSPTITGAPANSNAGSTLSNGGDGAHNNMPPGFAGNFIIKL